MLSAFQPACYSDSFMGNPFPTFEPDFSPWESIEPLVLNTPPSPHPEPAGSQEPIREVSEPRAVTSGSDETARLVDERKQRRKQSNRLSAQRSRIRKQRHLEKLRSEVTQLKAANQELLNRLRFAMHHTQAVVSQNESLRSEAVQLRQRLCHIRQMLLLRQLQQHLNPTAAAASKWTSYINNAAPPPLL